MDAHVLEQARRRIEQARAGSDVTGRFEAALERSRAEVEALATAAAELERSLPDRVGEAVRDGLAREVVPVARSLAEIRGLLNQALRRLERLEQELLAERSARIDDLEVLVELVSSGWQGVDARLERLERGSGGEVVHLRAGSQAAIA
jgi:ABC-type transporter Mla subunit MlaD